MQLEREDPVFERIATLDIETTHYDATEGELVSIGIGFHDRGTPGNAATYETFHRDGSGEVALVKRAMDHLTANKADGMVSYNGFRFDLPFIGDRLDILGQSVDPPELAESPETHLDLFLDRKKRAEDLDLDWPSLEQCLEAYSLPRPRTVWDGQVITNTRFGTTLGPEYLRAISDDKDFASTLTDVIDHYLITDLEANFAIFYSDIGEGFEYELLDTRREF